MQGVSLPSSKFYRTTFLVLFLAFFLTSLAIVVVFTGKTITAINENKITAARSNLEILYLNATDRLLNRNNPRLIFSTKTFPKVVFTLIDAEGKVVETTGSHTGKIYTWDSPLLIEAKLRSFGIQRKNIDDSNDRIMVAKAVRDEGRIIGGILVDLEAAEFKLGVEPFSNFLTSIVLICLICSLFFGFVLTRSAYEPLAQLLEVCKQISAGDYNRRVTILPNNEIGELGKTINLLSSDILRKITKLSLEKTQLKSILSVMTEGIISLNHNGDINFCNRNAYKIFGSEEKDVRGLNISVVEGFSLLADIADEVLLSKKMINKILHINIKQVGAGQTEDEDTSQTSQEKVIEVHAVYYNTRDYKDTDFPELHMRTRRGAIIIFQDVTDVKRLEVIRRDFFANVSHELKTPLTSIRGYVETLLDGALEDPNYSSRFVNKIGINAERLTELVYELLSLARIESAEEYEVEESLLWSPIISSIISRYEDMIKRKKLTISIDEEPSSFAVLGDQASMATVFENLLTNAIRYSHEGGMIEVQFRKRDDYFCLSVKDSGMGISKVNLERIFERFYRADKARTREIGGTGLGLSIVKHLVSRMNGRIEVESIEGAGATFSVFLPKAF